MTRRNRSIPLTEGDKFHRLTIVSLHHQDERRRRFYACLCDCGTTKVIQGSLMLSGNTRSCGCLSKDNGLAKKLPNDQGVINQLILGYKRHARDRGLVFELSKETFMQLIKQPCRYCGLPPSNNIITKNCNGF